MGKDSYLCEKLRQIGWERYQKRVNSGKMVRKKVLNGCWKYVNLGICHMVCKGKTINGCLMTCYCANTYKYMQWITRNV
jgi:hypothetical protein